MSETKATYPCGCVIQTVGEGTLYAGTVTHYCDTHNPYKNIAPQVEKI
jgi:hypothetical protein